MLEGDLYLQIGNNNQADTIVLLVSIIILKHFYNMQSRRPYRNIFR